MTTRLGRILSSDSDCLVDLIDPLDEDVPGFLSADLRDEVTSLVADLELGAHRTIALVARGLICSGDNPFPRLNPPLESFARELGFEQAAIRIQEMQDIRFRTLLGKPAPEVTLELLASGKPTPLRDLLAGKVALLTFWGYG